MDRRHKKKSTFMVEVQFQQHNTWQGTIHWLDGKKTQHFRSSLEMMKLMEDALNSEEEPELEPSK